MADSAVAVTAGTGTNIDTRTEATNGHHRQVVVLGDPATNAGVAPVDATAGLKVDLGSDNDVTVTGTVDLGATDNAVLDAIEADTTTIAGDTATIAGDTTSIDAKIPALGQALAAGSVPVVLTASQLTTLTPPAAITGFATSAKQDTIIGHVDGIEGLLTTIDADTGTIATEVAGLLTDTELRATPVPVSATDLDIRPLVNTDVVTAELSAVDNAVLDTIAAKDFATQTTLAAINTKLVTGTDIGDVTINNASGGSAVNIQDGGNTITVDYATTGSGTATGALRVELPTNGTGVIATVGAVTAITNALPAGTNAIGKLAANSGVDIGDVTLTAGTAAVGSILPPDTDVTAHTNYARKYYTNAGAVTDGIVWSPAAGKRWHVVTMYIQTSAAATITLEDDKAGGDDPVWKGEIAANSGVTLSFTEHYPLASGEDAADLIVTTSAGNVYITVVGFEI